MSAGDVREEALAAETRIRPYIRETPLEHSPFLSRKGKCEVFLKLENIQISGSFKLRGAVNKILALEPQERAKGLMTASSGNHGMAFAHITKKFGINGTVILPEIASEAKMNALHLYDITVEQHGDDCVKAERCARERAEEKGLIYVPPYNDPYIIGGQATIGIELNRQLTGIDTILVPVGGGGLISGIAGYLKTFDNPPEIIGCQPLNSRVMYESIKAGRILDMESQPTISDGSAGGIEKGSITFDLCRDLVDDFILLSEEEIIQALVLIMETHYLFIEGAAALTVAAFLKHPERFYGKKVALIISGAKLSLKTLKEIL
jgi:threonine dehydratase